MNVEVFKSSEFGSVRIAKKDKGVTNCDTFSKK
jgi:hypothetical protein